LTLSLRRIVTRFSPVRGDSALFLPRPLRKALAFLATFLIIGCASAAKQVAEYQNSYDFRIERSLESCVVATPPSECIEAYTELRAYEKHLHEAARAVGLGGMLPLQLKALKADAKKLAKRKVAR
jgi:hypothetical protein